MWFPDTGKTHGEKPAGIWRRRKRRRRRRRREKRRRRKKRRKRKRRWRKQGGKEKEEGEHLLEMVVLYSLEVVEMTFRKLLQ